MNVTAFSLLFLFLAGAVIAGAIIGLSALLGKPVRTKAHKIPYECGLDPVGTVRPRTPINFFLIAVLFIIFDVEIVFLYPWAVVFRDFVIKGDGFLMFFEMIVFVGILFLGLLYVWKRGALEWEEKS
ncbi:MAG: hypothetical protein A3I05_08445 [Deltaproteobacteria bacterium RIFCSPLOWO2_02_FULL_44_10]|nr:MAG: hypothetical protein A3C46_05490 [Deltaproteobacteria bacterium RIFCSPHIGHO2_02_FULL_44_16]OGQ45513.1 MAG: hypothetical protein A3I05_08445 [Deltaproteobacteria bacterium RIFCSPLOWO2_02_FULL_44_10]